MTKRIFRSIFSVSAVILVISIGLIMGLLYGHFGDQLEKELKQEAVYLAIAVENDGVESLNRLSKTGERVTLIDEDGTVLYDNKADAGTWRIIRTGRKFRRLRNPAKAMPPVLPPLSGKRPCITLCVWRMVRSFVCQVHSIQS